MNLNIAVRWLPGLLEWQDAAKLVNLQSYQRNLNSLEGLIVQQMFELTKMNQSQTDMLSDTCCFQYSHLYIGYKMRKHITHALQARSQAIHNALEWYNASALALSPPRTTLQWSEVVEYAFLADFDLLQDT
jgi:hypothetical protein